MKLVRNEEVVWMNALGYREKTLVQDKDVNLTGGLVQLVEVPPHTEVKDHYHTSSTEVVHVLSGKGVFHIDGRRIELEPGQTLACEPFEVRSTDNPFDYPFTYIVFRTNSASNDRIWCER